MADMKISALGAASALGGTELLAGVQGGSNVRITPAQMLAYIIAAGSMTEAVQDMIGSFLAAGTGIALTYNDAGNALTIASSDPKSNYSATDPSSASDGAQGYAVGSIWFNSATGVSWRCIDASAGAAVWSPMGAMDHPGYTSGRYYPAQRSAVSTSIAVAADTLYGMPIYIAQRVTLSALAIRIQTGVASTAVLLGLYNNVAARPGTLIAGASSVATTTSAADAIGTFASNVTIAPGVYWIAALFNGAPTPISMAGGDQVVTSLLGANSVNSATSTSSAITGCTASTPYSGGLPASFNATSLPGGSSGIPLGVIKIA